ncbi:MAG: hypothetical protein ACREVY_16125 [Gammaproteobacteria bacterium]
MSSAYGEGTISSAESTSSNANSGGAMIFTPWAAYASEANADSAANTAVNANLPELLRIVFSCRVNWTEHLSNARGNFRARKFNRDDGSVTVPWRLS